jgi:oligoendopeptidase F
MSNTAAPELNLEKIPAYQKRSFVPETFKISTPESLVEFYKKLIDRKLSSSKDLEGWLLDRSELEAVIDQEASIRYIRMTCQTDHEPFAQDYQYFIETIAPVIKPLQDDLNKKFLEMSKKFPLDPKRYGVYIKDVQTDVDIFRKENVPLQTKIDLLSQEYQKICGAMTVVFKGEEQTLAQMGRYLQEPDRKVREEAWRLMAERRLKDKVQLDQIFNDMLKIRHQIALQAGFKNFRDYKFVSLHRFDYTPQDCKKFHETVEKIVVPLWAKILDRRRKEMKLEGLKPWDVGVDPLGRPSLKPFSKVEDLIKKCQDIFYKVDKDLGQKFEDMVKLNLLDLASRKGKAPGGYQSSLAESRKPFIFMNAVGVDDDVRTLLHEAGHAFHAVLAKDEPLLSYRHGPMEFCEVASMSMELLGGKYLSIFYNTEDENRSNISHLEDVIGLLIWVATIDSFQHWIYENPAHTPMERKKEWINVRARFGGDLLDWKGLEEEHGYLWHRQLHIFEVPFYYIEYGIAQLGALQIWRNAKSDWPKAVLSYQKALKLGGSQPLKELFEAADIKFDFGEKMIKPLMDEVKKEIEID